VLAVLDRKFFAELLLNALFTFVVITTVALIAIASVAFFRFSQLDLVLYLSLVRFMLIQALSYLLPLSMLIAVVCVYGRAAADHEVTTLKASGIHPFRILAPGVLLALLLGVVCLEVESRWGPWALYELRALPATQEALRPMLETAIAEKRRMVSFGNRDSDFTLMWSDANLLPAGGVVLNGVLIELDPKKTAKTAAAKGAAERTSVSADRAEVRFDERRREVRLLLHGAKVIAGPMRDFEVEQPELVLSVPPPMDRSRLKFQTSDELFALRARGRSSVEAAGETQPLLRAYTLDDVEGRIQERFARAASPLAFLLLGFPLAIVFRSGNRMIAFLLATLIGLFVYYPTDKLADTMLEQHLVGPITACWSGDALIASIGLLLLLFVVRR
jgi:lipopolysaccharide export LptBFGC system permease protein LptF